MTKLIYRVNSKLRRMKDATITKTEAKLPYSVLRAKRKYVSKSYSQSGEDLIIKFIFETHGVQKITYMDIGAHDPFYINNTAIFYASGSRGINIEPDPELFRKFTQARRKDVNLNIGVSTKKATLELYIMSSPTLNTFSKSEAEAYEKEGYKIVRTHKIKVEPIRDIVTKYLKKKKLDLLTIDVEGLDYEILKSVDFSKIQPRVICAETVEFTNDDTGKKDLRITELLERNGYKVYADTRINTIYVKKDWAI